MDDLSVSIAESCVKSLSPEAMVNVLSKLQESRDRYHGEAAVRKVELQKSNKGVQRLSKRVARLRERVRELECAVGTMTDTAKVLSAAAGWSHINTGVGLSENEEELLKSMVRMQRELAEARTLRKREMWYGQGELHEIA